MFSTDENGQAAASATANGTEYIIHYSGIELIVHRRVPCPRPGGHSERYYIESSDRIPIDSTDAPLACIWMAILLTALRILPDPSTLSFEDAPTPYSGTVEKPSSRTYPPPALTRSSIRGGRAHSSDCQAVPQSRPLVHFDIEGLNKDVTFLVDVLATPSSPLELLPSLNGLYWERALSFSDPAASEDSGYLSGLLHRSWHPWGCLFSQRAIKREDTLRGLVLWTQCWERWKSVRRALDADLPDLLVTPVTYRYLTPPEDGAFSTINFTEYIANGATGMAHRGSWYDASVVAKHSVPRDSEALAREALFYKHHLARLRGIVVPEFLGLYRSDGWSLLVLEDVGPTTKPTANPWEGWSEQQRCVDASSRSPIKDAPPDIALRARLALYCRLFLIHMAGLIHGDFREHNMVNNARGVRVIDFSHAKTHMSRARALRRVRFNTASS
jgi:hypothetical protein